MIDFETYHKQNPEIWEQFVKFARQTKERRICNSRSKRIINVGTGVSGNDGFKINNNYAPDYANSWKNSPSLKICIKPKLRCISNN